MNNAQRTSVVQPVVHPVQQVGLNIAVLGRVAPRKKWWEIDSLDIADIIDVWTFDNDSGTELTGEVNGETWEIFMGSPSITPGVGFNFGGGGGARFILPANTEISELSTVMQFSDAIQNGTLDAFFSHFQSSSHYTLQNAFNTKLVRWSCGDGDSSTIEIDASSINMNNNIYGVSGGSLYIAGEKKGDVPDTGWVIVNGQPFNLGLIQVDSGHTQNIRAKINKLLIVKRLLTDEEQLQLALQAKGCYKLPNHNLYNDDFNCGVMGWTYNPSWTAVLTDNGDGSIHLQSTSNYGSVVPMFVPTESANWQIEVSVRNQNEPAGKISVRDDTGSWHTTDIPQDDGIYTLDYSGVITEINVGAKGSATYEADYDFIHLRRLT